MIRSPVFKRSLSRQNYVYKIPRIYASRVFHISARVLVVKPFLLADIGEGIRECEIIQWFVEPEARVEEFDKICEVQSDKASVEIPSRFTGVIKRLHYDTGEMAIVGKPLIDIDVEDDVVDDLDAELEDRIGHPKEIPEASRSPRKTNESTQETKNGDTITEEGKYAALATPAVRHLTKELDVDITDVHGTGRDGRVLKDDVYKFSEARNSRPTARVETTTVHQLIASPSVDGGLQKETVVQLNRTQAQMFKTMTKSLTIPHFLYADEVDLSALSDIRRRLNRSLSKTANGKDFNKLSFMPFIIKAISLSLKQYPVLNARVDIDPDSNKPILLMRHQHNIGIAMDTAQGLIVPVITNVASRSIFSIGLELNRLKELATSGKMSSEELTGGTITVSNIGSIGGTYVAPVIVEKEISILGVGKIRTTPAFDEAGNIVKKQICNFSWSADHRVIDGATMARAAELVRGFIEEPDSMMMYLR